MRFIKPARPVSTVYIHCSASDNPKHDNVATIDAWHRARGWSGVGYHFYGPKSGGVEEGRSVEKTPAAQKGHNRGSLTYCLGGLKLDKFTKAQLNSLIDWCWQVNDAYGSRIKFRGHNEVSAKDCPVIDIQEVLGLDADGYLIGPRPDNLDVVHAPVNAEIHGNNTIYQKGDRGTEVEIYQMRLDKLGYSLGKIDGWFGTLMHSAVIAFQDDNHLITDGRIGTLTKEAFADAVPRQASPTRQAATIASLATDGSRIADASIKSLTAGAAVSVSGIVSVLPFFSGTFQSLKDQIAPVLEPFGGMSDAVTYGLLAAVGYLTWQAWRSGTARVEDHKTGKTS